MSLRTFYFPYKRFTKILALILIFFSSFSLVKAAYERYGVGETVVIGEFVYDDDFVATTTANCLVSIWDPNPSDSIVVDNASMTASTTGWYYYNFLIPSIGPEGIWPAQMTCGSVIGGDLVRMDKTFSVGATISLASSSLASAITKATTDVNAYTDSQVSSAISTINSHTDATVLTASTSLAGTIPVLVWSQGTRSLTTFGALAADVWNIATSTLTTVGTIGNQLANLSSLGSEITASDVWTFSTRRLTDGILGAGNLAMQSDVTNASSSLAANIGAGTASTAGTISSAITTINNNTNATVLTASTSLAGTIPVAVWAATSRSLTTFGTLAADVWTNGTRTLTSGIGITASDVWTYATRNLTDATLSAGSLATAANVTSASSSISANITSTQTAINNNTNSSILNASTSLAANITGAQTNINANTNATVLSASSSLAAIITSLPSTIWTYSTRTLTSAAGIASDVWNATTRTLTSLTLSSQSPWTVSTSDFGTITAGSNYLATITTIYNGTLTDSLNIPSVTIYDPNRNVITNNVAMTRTATGTYSYAYTTAGNAAAGTWESVFSANVETGKTLPGNDYWTVVTNPAQVIINSITDNTIPQVAANITITNEGLSGNEYQYEWCVVSDTNNTCGGGDDVFHALAAKYINPGEDFNTVLTADVPSAGNYYFKVIVYFGTDSSGASRTFTAVAGTGANTEGNGGGGGGGGSPTVPPASEGCSRRADFNCDTKANSIDFSILLYFWKSKPPFSNKYVDINKDGKINSVDFSILLYEWDKKK